MPRELTADPAAIAYADSSAADDAARLRETVVRAAWDALGVTEKDAVLATATADIDTIGDDFLGERADDDQLLEWPRTGTDYSDDAWPQRLVDATIALAFEYAPAFASGSTTNLLAPDPAEPNIKREKVGPIETEYFASRSVEATGLERFPPVVQRLLRPLVSVVEENAWGSASVVRGS